METFSAPWMRGSGLPPFQAQEASRTCAHAVWMAQAGTPGMFR